MGPGSPVISDARGDELLALGIEPESEFAGSTRLDSGFERLLELVEVLCFGSPPIEAKRAVRLGSLFVPAGFAGSGAKETDLVEWPAVRSGISKDLFAGS